MNENYAEAVVFAIKFLELGNHSARGSNHLIEPTELLYNFALDIRLHTDDHPWCGNYYTYRKHAFKFLLMRSDTEKGAFDIASRIVATKLLRGEEMQLEERVFSAEVLAGKRKCPPPEGKRLAKNFATNVHAVYLAEELVARFGLNHTRNDEPPFKDSACDAVSEAFANVGVQKSFGAIKSLLTHKSSERARNVASAIRGFKSQEYIDSVEAIDWPDVGV